MKPLSRRRFLVLAGAATAVGAVTAVSAAFPTEPLRAHPPAGRAPDAELRRQAHEMVAGSDGKGLEFRWEEKGRWFEREWPSAEAFLADSRPLARSSGHDINRIAGELRRLLENARRTT